LDWGGEVSIPGALLDAPMQLKRMDGMPNASVQVSGTISIEWLSGYL
jgi:hypothetical protein